MKMTLDYWDKSLLKLSDSKLFIILPLLYQQKRLLFFTQQSNLLLFLQSKYLIARTIHLNSSFITNLISLDLDLTPCFKMILSDKN